MTSRERRNKIMEMLRENKSVYISDLAKFFDVSAMTIRRDLQKFSEMGAITLIHCGATLNEGTMPLATVKARSQRMTLEKYKIAQYCAGLIRPGNSVYLDAGSTTIEIAEAIKGLQNIAVLTNSLPVQNILSDSEKIQLFSMPGIYDKTSKGFFGDMTCRFIRTFNIDIAFFGLDSIDISKGITTPDLKDQSIKMAILERANKKVAAVDHTKINKATFAQVCPINSLNMIVTGKAADKEFVEKARKRGVEVVQV